MNQYKKKRNFKKTPEPDQNNNHNYSQVFLVQEHAASHHHYDFRVEIDGRLKSWAIPKGPSMNPKEKRLAILTEDHPLSYYDFKGEIPKGEYGAGKVLIWDRGSYDNLRSCKMLTAYKQGKIEIALQGKKLKGKFALIRTQRKSKNSNKNDWLLLKMKDQYADARTNITNSKLKSVVSNKKISDL